MITIRWQLCQPFAHLRQDSFKGVSEWTLNIGLFAVEPIICNSKDLELLVEKLGMSTVTEYELNEMFEDGVHYMQVCSIQFDLSAKVTLQVIVLNSQCECVCWCHLVMTKLSVALLRLSAD